MAAIPFAALGRDVGPWAAMVVASAAGLVAVALLLDTVRRLRPGLVSPWAALVGGAVVVVTWGDVAVRTAHIDDAIALLAVVAALRWCAMDRGGAATVALAIAAAAKPWAVIFAPLALVPSGRLRAARVGCIAAFVALTWAPFVLAEPATLDVADFGIDNDPTSVLRVLGVDAATTPGWVRPAQLVGGIAVVAAAVFARRWPWALLLGVTWRLLLEPGAHRYYTVGIVLGALLVELVARPHRLPWATIAVAAALEVTALPGFPGTAGSALRLICLLAVAGCSLGWGAGRQEAQARP